MKRKTESIPMQPTTLEPRLLTEKEVSQMTGLALSTLRHWRVRRVGPPYLKLGRKRQGAVRYNLADVVRWTENFRVETREEGR